MTAAGAVTTVPALSGIELLRQAVASGAPPPPAAALLGWQALLIEPGRVRVRYAADERFYNPHGCVQGGFIAAMLDDAMGPAGLTLLGPGEFAPTLEIKVTFLRPARAGTLIAEGRALHRTRRVLFVEGSLMTEDGTPVATATATLLISGSGSEARNGSAG